MCGALKIRKIVLGIAILSVAFYGSVLIHDGIRERSLQRNKHLIVKGMSRGEVIELLGEPTCTKISDIPGYYASFGGTTWDRYTQDNCGSILIEMSYEGYVVQPPQ